MIEQKKPCSSNYVLNIICTILYSGDDDFEDEGWEEDFDDEDDYYDWHGETGDFTKKYNAATANAQQVNMIFNRRSLHDTILTSPNQNVMIPTSVFFVIFL
jgi:hypothetical protein